MINAEYMIRATSVNQYRSDSLRLLRLAVADHKSYILPPMFRFDKKLLFYKLPPVLYAGLIMSLSAISTPPTPDLGISWEDKIYHFIEYLVFGLLVVRAFPGVHLSPRCCLGITLLLVFGFAYAAFDEIVQYFVPTRDSSLGDWLADIIGYLAGAALFFWLRAGKATTTNSN